MSDTPILLPHAVDLLYLCASYGGIGNCSPYISYILPIVWSLCLAHKGITVTRTTAKNHLWPSHWSLFTNWQSSDSRLFWCYHTYGKDILWACFPDNPSTHHLDLFTSTDLDLHGFCRDFHCCFFKTQLAQVSSHCHTCNNAKSLTVPWMSLALHSMYQQHKDHQLDCTTYWLALQCQLWLTVLPPFTHWH
jgi:hypothetical protein